MFRPLSKSVKSNNIFYGNEDRKKINVKCVLICLLKLLNDIKSYTAKMYT